MSYTQIFYWVASLVAVGIIVYAWGYHNGTKDGLALARSLREAKETLATAKKMGL